MKKNIRMLVVFCLLIISLTGIIHAEQYQYDFGGQTLRFSFRFHNVTPIGPRGAFDWYNPDPRLQAHIEAVEQMFNCKIEFVTPYVNPNDVANAIRQGALAGRGEIDYAQMMTWTFPSLAVEGYLLPLDDVIGENYYDSFPLEFQPLQEAFKLLGTTYAVPSQGDLWSDPSGIDWNKTKFEQEGLPSLYDLYESGAWTWGAFQDIARKATRDTDGDGVIDQRGARLRSVLNWIKTNNGNVAEQKDGKWMLTLAKEENVEAWDFMHQLVSEGVGSFNILESQVLMYEPFVHIINNWSINKNPVVDEYEWGIVPYPKGPRADEHVSLQMAVLHGGVLPITLDKDPRGVIEVVNALQMLSETYRSFEDWEQFYWRDRINAVFDYESLQNWQWIERNAVLFPDPLIFLALEQAGWARYKGGQIGNRIIDGGQSSTAVMAELQPRAQAILDEILKQ